MDKLTEGMHVEIIRSDGRVHGAIICHINHTSSSVSVEWFEKVFSLCITYKYFKIKGETKGKEVDFNALVKHNPLIFRTTTKPSETSTINGDIGKSIEKRRTTTSSALDLQSKTNKKFFNLIT